MICKPSRINLSLGFCCVKVTDDSSLNEEANFFFFFLSLWLSTDILWAEMSFLITIGIFVVKVFAKVWVQVINTCVATWVKSCKTTTAFFCPTIFKLVEAVVKQASCWLSLAAGLLCFWLESFPSPAGSFPEACVLAEPGFFIDRRHPGFPSWSRWWGLCVCQWDHQLWSTSLWEELAHGRKSTLS